MKSSLRVLFIASEAEPLVKVGGLGDVAGALPQALLDLPTTTTGNYKLDVRLCIPFYPCINAEALNPNKILNLKVKKGSSYESAEVFQGELGNLPVYLIKGPPINSSGNVYSLDTRMDGEKFAFFSLAALELIKSGDWKPDILHANDWHTALAIHCLHSQQKVEKSFKKISTIVTLHNLPFMGAGTEAALVEYKIPPSLDPNLPKWARTLPLPMGLSAADRIVAVSPNYAKELLTAEFGNDLQSFFKLNQEKLSGIINGLDTKTWNPFSDKYILQNYNFMTLEGKKLNKVQVLKSHHLTGSIKAPLLISISRMDQQKGIDIILDALRKIAKYRWQAIVLGSGNPKLEKANKALEKEFPGRFRAIVKYDPALSHQLYSAADIYMMPSRYEPCGLSQLIAMNYGCIPVARNTGGLHDTIRQTYPNRPGTGFLFQKATPDALAEKLVESLSAIKNKPFWTRIQKNAMQKDFSWKVSAAAYFDLYRQLVEKENL